VIGLKLASTGWRAARYYGRAEEYVLRGPPALLLRVLVAPLVVLSTLVLFGTGVALLALGETHGTLVGLHKAGFLVWLGSTSVHVLAHLRRMPRLLRGRAPGAPMRLGLAAAALAAGVALAVATLPAADALQDHVTAHVGIDRT
jgi:hypothetical protein